MNMFLNKTFILVNRVGVKTQGVGLGARGELRCEVSVLSLEDQVVKVFEGRDSANLLLVAEFVANPPNGQNHLGIVGVVLDFGAQAVYV